MHNKVAIVTGASRGVGKALAIYLAEMKYKVVLIARNETLLYQLNQQINNNNGVSSFFSLDVSNSSQVKACIQNIINEYGRIDLLINNAAILKRGTTDLADEEIDVLLKINLNGAIYVAKYVAAQMKKQGGGYIMNISSLGGKVAASFSGIYAASKFGLSGFSEALSKEMSLYGVKVTNICPSMIATEMAEGRKFKLEQMIQLDDLTKTVGYLLSLSPNAIPTEILINCLPLIEKTTESLQKMYLN
ncbi:MAG: SDR family NAD(P)-dependent oxidoreductase [Legionella sp.]|uniref:SDR family oxidoreductase n=1 Tax=Legionella sp. TaxID=459 RepID=UPI00284814DB|nr:SDR family NAD(P)-dependent oxidoreductase [Legionella sp.]